MIRRVTRLLTEASDAVRAKGRQLLVAYVPSESQYIFALTLVIGAVCGLVAVGFHLAIGLAEHLLIDRAMHAVGWTWVAWTVVTPALGGLLAGIALVWLPEARGSGIPQVKKSFALNHGHIRFRDAVGKFAISVVQIGSGASLGREGPTVFLTAGTASLLSSFTPLPPKSKRRLMPVGVAAGIAAAFNAPIAAVTFTIEEIVGTLDQTVLSGVVVAAAVAAVIERSVLGVHPVIEVAQGFSLEHASSLPFYALLGVCAAFVSVLFTDSILQVRTGFRNLQSVPLWAQPAVGGLFTGCLAAAVLWFMKTEGVTGGGYETLGRALAGRLAVDVLVVLCLAKVAATVVSYSSGGAGGIFAPSLFVGAMLGGVLGYLDMALLDHNGHELGAFALVGMGAAFAGIVRAPITSVLIIFEMTGSYGLVLPLMIANMTSYGLARHFRPTPLYDALLEQDGVHLPSRTDHPRSVDSLLSTRVALVAIKAEPVPASVALEPLLTLLVAAKGGALPLEASGTTHALLLVETVRARLLEGKALLAADVARKAPAISAAADLLEALRLMELHQIDALPVIDAPDSLQAHAVLTRSDVGHFLSSHYARNKPTPA